MVLLMFDTADIYTCEHTLYTHGECGDLMLNAIEKLNRNGSGTRRARKKIIDDLFSAFFSSSFFCCSVITGDGDGSSRSVLGSLAFINNLIQYINANPK